MIADISRYVRLGAGDLIFTGTPEGVGPVKSGDLLECAIRNCGASEDLVGMHVKI